MIETRRPNHDEVQAVTAIKRLRRKRVAGNPLHTIALGVTKYQTVRNSPCTALNLSNAIQWRKPVTFSNNPPEQISAFVVGLAWNLQQALRYGLYGVTMNFLSEKVFTPRDLYANDTVKSIFD